MDLGSPLRTLIPSLDSAVLEVLARSEQPQSASAIWRASSRGTRAGQLPVLNRLVQHGLVNAFPAATGHLYALNHDHVLVDAVLAAADARVRLVGRLRERLQQLDPPPLHAFLFGSFARGEADDHSDIDLAVIVADTVDPRSDEWRTQAGATADDVGRWTGNSLQVLSFTARKVRELIATGEPIVQNWRDDGLRLIGDDPSVLLNRKASS
ncbi:nucleotidyltransferase domain-containing protein [Microbacterium sp. H1-D42]|uniref:nucleotidyltransferase domain-containing protein n=1 Tax=Microbacterium sp. H1-D42 TaxID=2925844 RepID=UPI001F53946C|nr:nucleotidyltransferase domain-containing protein [Microbacterium sp. H1-D42]UNK71027.1 nucleotidyltransferase domain-containing protein [Microbacterium sp. H1-D42]